MSSGGAAGAAFTKIRRANALNSKIGSIKAFTVKKETKTFGTNFFKFELGATREKIAIRVRVTDCSIAKNSLILLLACFCIA